MIRQTDIYSVIPTVRVMREDGNGARIINERDFDPSRHRLADSARREDERQKETIEPKRKRGRPRKATNLTE